MADLRCTNAQPAEASHICGVFHADVEGLSAAYIVLFGLATNWFA